VPLTIWHLQISADKRIITDVEGNAIVLSSVSVQKNKNKNEGNNNKDKLGKLRMQATVQTSVINHRLADTGERDIPTVSPRGRYFVCSFIIIFFFLDGGKNRKLPWRVMFCFSF